MPTAGGASAGLVLVLTALAGAQAPEVVRRDHKVIADDGSQQDLFGWVDLCGDTLVVGAPGDGTGSVYVFEHSAWGWAQTAKLKPSWLNPGAEFGLSVAVDGDTLVVGARGHDLGDPDDAADYGAVFVFQRLGGVWTEQAMLTGPVPAWQTYLGWSVDLSGNTIVAGAPEDYEVAFRAGAVHVWTGGGSSWTHRAKISDPLGSQDDHFGKDIALSGGTLAVGCLNDDDVAFNAGSVYVYTGGGAIWALEAKLLAVDAESNDNLGLDVALDRDTLVAGSKNDASSGDHSGAGYVFTRSAGSWSQEAKLLATDPATGTRFGRAVAVSGEVAVVGDFYDDDNGFAGAAYLYERRLGLWSPGTKIGAGDHMFFDGFGMDVAIDGELVCIGAPFTDEACPSNTNCNSGSAYLFPLLFK